jgi:hypothetical protein
MGSPRSVIGSDDTRVRGSNGACCDGFGPEPGRDRRRLGRVLRLLVADDLSAPYRALRNVVIASVVSVAIAAGCAATGPAPTPAVTATGIPAPACGGLKILIPDALSCERVVSTALQALAERSPDQLRRGITGIDVVLGQCPRGEMPPMIDCGTEQFAQMVTVEFGPAPPGGPIEPSLTVAVAPVTGAILGISNPLIR